VCGRVRGEDRLEAARGRSVVNFVVLNYIY